jgi:hypothetical protein
MLFATSRSRPIDPFGDQNGRRRSPVQDLLFTVLAALLLGETGLVQMMQEDTRGSKRRGKLELKKITPALAGVKSWDGVDSVAF